MRSTAKLIRTCVRSGVPCMLENSTNSMLWQAPPILSLLRLKCAKSFTTDQCGFGTRWRKRTRFVFFHIDHNPAFDVRCCGRNQCCSFSGKPHVVLTGRDPVSGLLWTSLAVGYPPKLAHCIASTFARTVESLKLARLYQLSGLG